MPPSLNLVEINYKIVLFQNPVDFVPSSWKNRSRPGFSTKFKEAVPIAEVLEQPHLFSLNKPNLARFLLSLSRGMAVYNFFSFITFGIEPASVKTGNRLFVFPRHPAVGAHALRRGNNRTRSSK
jgi:hypothetical protein